MTKPFDALVAKLRGGNYKWIPSEHGYNLINAQNCRVVEKARILWEAHKLTTQLQAAGIVVDDSYFFGQKEEKGDEQ